MKILSIDHVQLAMPMGKEDQARAFFCDILGFHEKQKPAALAGRGGAWFESENVEAFIVDDLDAIIAKVQNAGYETDTNQPPLDGVSS